MIKKSMVVGIEKKRTSSTLEENSEKKEDIESTLELTIIKLIRQHATAGITQPMLLNELPGVSVDQISGIMNKLSTEGRISLFKDHLGLVYKEVSPEELNKFKGLGKEDMLIYQLIEQAGNKGIWTKEIKNKTNLQQPQITKSFKALEGRKLVKCIPSVQTKNRKVYMLFDLEPHPDVTGDVWYNQSGQEIDAEFINILNQQCYKYIVTKGYASSEEVCSFIRKSGLSKVDLKVQNIQSIIETLIYDGKVESVDHPRGRAFLAGKSVWYKPTNLGILSNGFTQTPCGVCPIFRLCSSEGEITPIKCLYLKDWLEF